MPNNTDNDLDINFFSGSVPETVDLGNIGVDHVALAADKAAQKADEYKNSLLGTLDQQSSLSDSVSVFDDNTIESNRQKLWNDFSDQEYQSVLHHGLKNFEITRDADGEMRLPNGEKYTGQVKRLYAFGTKDNTNEEVKFGIARGDMGDSALRYTKDGHETGYGWTPGEAGVDVDKKYLDSLLPADVAVMLESLAHGRTAARQHRVVKDQFGDAITVGKYGTGASEYYTSLDGLLGKAQNIDAEKGALLFNERIAEVRGLMPELVGEFGQSEKEEREKRIKQNTKEFEADNMGFLGRVSNIQKGFSVSFVDSLIAQPLDAIGDATNLFDLGSSEEITEWLHDKWGFNNAKSKQAMEEVRTSFNVMASSESTTQQKVKAAFNGVKEAFLNPELLSTSTGAVASWFTPGAVLKFLGVGSKFYNTSRIIDARVAKGAITASAGRAAKLKNMASVPGAKAALANQSGFMAAAVGQTNSQYDEFVKNNNGKELTGADKVQFMAGRFAVNMVSMNIDKLTTFAIVKNSNMLAAAVPAFKAMTNKELSKVSKAIGGAIKKAGKVAAGSAAAASVEAVQEYTQTMMEMYNTRYGSEKFKDIESFTAFITDERNTTEAGIAALAGAGGGLQFKALGDSIRAVKPVTSPVIKAYQKRKEKKAKAKAELDQQVAAAEAASVSTPDVTIVDDAELAQSAETSADNIAAKYASLLDDNEFVQVFAAATQEEQEKVDTPGLRDGIKNAGRRFKDILEELETAEAVLAERVSKESTPSDTDVASLNVVRKSRQEALKVIMTSKTQPTLGSGYSPKEVLTDFLQVSGTEISTQDLALAVKYAKTHKIPKLAFTRIRKQAEGRKNALDVWKESVGEGKASASTYRNTLTRELSKESPNKAVVASSLENTERFLLNREQREKNVNSVLKEVRNNVAAYNKQVQSGNSPAPFEKTRLLKGKDIPEYAGGFIAVSEDKATGLLKVSPQSEALAISVSDTVDYLKTTLNRYREAANSVISENVNVRKEKPSRQQADTSKQGTSGKSEQSKSEQSKSEQSKSEQSKSEQSKSEQSKSEQGTEEKTTTSSVLAEAKTEQAKESRPKAPEVPLRQRTITAVDEGLGVKGTKKLFKGSTKAMLKFYDSIAEEESRRIVKLLEDKSGKDYDTELARVTDIVEKGKATKKGLASALKELGKREAQKETNKKLRSLWLAQDPTTVDSWVKENVPTAKKFIQRTLNRSLGKGKKPVYAVKIDGKYAISTKVDPEKNSQYLYQKIAADPNTYVKVVKTTLLNSAPVRLLHTGPDSTPTLKAITTDAKKRVASVLKAPNVNSPSIIPFADSPINGFLFGRDGEIDENVAAAIRLATVNYLGNNAFLLGTDTNDTKTIADMVGMQEEEINSKLVSLLEDKGVFYKNVAYGIGKDVANLLGIGRDTNSEEGAQNYDTLITDLGSVGVLTAISDGILKTDDSVTVGEYLDAAGQSSGTSKIKATIRFVSATEAGKTVLALFAEDAKKLDKELPNNTLQVKPPRFNKLDGKGLKALTSKVRNDVLGMAVPEKAKKVIHKFANTEFTMDKELSSYVVLHRKKIRKLLGYVDLDNDDTSGLTYEQLRAQPAINRGIEKSIQDIDDLLKEFAEKNKNKTEKTYKLYFDFFFGKNGRYYLDSNTINPVTDKQLHRFIFQPTSHRVKIRRVSSADGSSRFMSGGKDITYNVQYALTQALGMSTDKESKQAIVAFSDNILRKLNTGAAVSEALEEFTATGKVESLGVGMEHFAHAIQAFNFLDKLAQSSVVSTSLSAEFDAVTSGFGLKLLQMPIIGNMRAWFQKVGVFFGDDPVLDSFDSMNDVLASKTVLDSYQTLAASIKKLSFEEVQRNSTQGVQGKIVQVVKDTQNNRRIWEALSDVLPSVNVAGVVDEELRNIFKLPFMTFNYSSAISTIKTTLIRGELVKKMAGKLLSEDALDKNTTVGALAYSLAENLEGVKALQKDIREKSVDRIRAANTSNLEKTLGELIEHSYGKQVGDTLETAFETFLDAQSIINKGYRHLFEVFFVEYEREYEKLLKEKQTVSRADEKSLLESLKNKWPAIRGPFSKLSEEIQKDVSDGIAVYAVDSVNPEGAFSTRKAGRVSLSDNMQKTVGSGKQIRTSTLIKQMRAAVSAGSVLQVHYTDAAIMGETVLQAEESGLRDIVTVHDAIIPAVTDIDSAVGLYNKNTFNVSQEYSAVEALSEALSQVDAASVYGPDTEKRYALTEVITDVNVLNKQVQRSRNEVQKVVRKHGVKIMHMAGTAESAYIVKPDESNQIDQEATGKYNSKNNTTKQVLARLFKAAQNIC